MLRFKDGLPTMKSMNYCVNLVQGQFKIKDELIEKNSIITQDLIE